MPAKKDLRSADAEKENENREGKQHTLNTTKSNQAKKEAPKDSEKENKSEEKATSQRKDVKSAENCTTHWEDEDHLDKNFAEYKKFQERNRQSAKDDKKRATTANGSSPNKKQKTDGKKQDEPTGSAGSITRVPKHGQKAQWHALPGWVNGEVVEVLYKEKEVEGKRVKASKEDPRIVLKSDSSGKICVHKPDNVYFD